MWLISLLIEFWSVEYINQLHYRYFDFYLILIIWMWFSLLSINEICFVPDVVASFAVATQTATWAHRNAGRVAHMKNRTTANMELEVDPWRQSLMKSKGISNITQCM